MSENTERATKNGQSRESGNTGHTRGRKTTQTQIQHVPDTTIRKQTQAT